MTADQLASHLAVSPRTIYRDIKTLTATGIKIRGEAGVGYRLTGGPSLPAMQLTDNERQVLCLGIQWMETWADDELARTARQLFLKLHTPNRRPEEPNDRLATLYAPPGGWSTGHRPWFSLMRKAINRGHKVRIEYCDGADIQTCRTIQPLGLFYWGSTWTVAAFCDLRDTYRSFRIDRVKTCILLDEQPIDTNGGINLARYLEQKPWAQPVSHR